MANVIAFFVAHKVLVLSVLLGVSEMLALIPALKSNGILDFMKNLFKQGGAIDPEAK